MISAVNISYFFYMHLVCHLVYYCLPAAALFLALVPDLSNFG